MYFSNPNIWENQGDAYFQVSQHATGKWPHKESPLKNTSGTVLWHHSCQWCHRMIDSQLSQIHCSQLDTSITGALSRKQSVSEQSDSGRSQFRCAEVKGGDVNRLALFLTFLISSSLQLQRGPLSLRLDSLFKSNAISSRSAPGLSLHPNNTFSPGRDSNHH